MKRALLVLLLFLAPLCAQNWPPLRINPNATVTAMEHQGRPAITIAWTPRPNEPILWVQPYWGQWTVHAVLVIDPRAPRDLWLDLWYPTNQNPLHPTGELFGWFGPSRGKAVDVFEWDFYIHTTDYWRTWEFPLFLSYCPSREAFRMGIPCQEPWPFPLSPSPALVMVFMSWKGW